MGDKKQFYIEYLRWNNAILAFVSTVEWRRNADTLEREFRLIRLNGAERELGLVRRLYLGFFSPQNFWFVLRGCPW